MPKNYTISEDGQSIKCHNCGRTSWNVNDVKERYCGACHVFHDDPTVDMAAAADRSEPAPLDWVKVSIDVPGGMVYLTFDQGAYGRYLTQAEAVALIAELRRAIGLDAPGKG